MTKVVTNYSLNVALAGFDIMTLGKCNVLNQITQSEILCVNVA